MNDENASLSVVFGGDVGPVRQPVERLVELAQPFLRTADFRFGQCERTYSHRGAFPQWATIPRGEWSRLSPEYASIFTAAEIDVVSMASNHALDWGLDPLMDTIELFRSQGMQVVGAGLTESSAREAAILEKNGVRVGVLAYCSVLRDGWAAQGDHPGLASIRVRTWYEDIDFQAGCPPVVRSQAYEEDVEAMQRDISALREHCHAVVVSMHWGIRHIPKVLAEYQRPVAHAAIDAGADLIVGHHPHVPKGVEVYKGKVCLYSIGNFLTTGTLHVSDKPRPEWNLYWYEPDPDSLYGFTEYCKQALLPKVTFTEDGEPRVALSLAYINDLAQPEILAASDPRFSQVLDYVSWTSNYLPHQLVVEGDEAVVVDAS